MIRIACIVLFLCTLLGCERRPVVGPTTPQIDSGKEKQKKNADEALDQQLAAKGPEAVKALGTALNKSEVVSAGTLYLASHVAFKENRLEDSAFLFYAAQLRAHFDKACFPPKGTGGDSPFVAYGAMSFQIGSVVNPAVMNEPKVFAKAIDRVKAWSPKAPKDYNPGYEYSERKTEDAARETAKENRDEFIEKMSGISKLLNDPEYFAAFRIHQTFNLTMDDKRPSKEENEKAMGVMKRIEKEKGITGFMTKVARPGTGFTKVDGEWVYATTNTGSGKALHKLKADKSTFAILEDKDYAKDQDRVFYRRDEIAGADPVSFQVITDESVAKDKNHVYIMTHKILGADPASFKMIRAPYSRDAVRVYCGTVPMETANVNTFEPLECEDGWRNTYNKGSFLFEFGEAFSNLKISQEHPVVTGTGWGRDGKHYYYGPGRVEGADYASFKITSTYESVDKNRKYRYVFPANELETRRRFFGMK